MKTKAVLLDLDGTLRDTRDAIYDALQYAIKVHSGREVTRAEIKPYVHHHTVVHRAFAGHVAADLFEQTYIAAVDPAVEKSVLYPGVEALLDRLRTDGYKTAIVTSAMQHRAERFLETLGLAGRCDAIVGMTPGRSPKPAPDLLEIALRLLDCSPSEAVMLGDMTVDVEAAHAAGVKCVAVTHGFATKAELRAAGADYIIDSLAELPDVVGRLRAK